MKIKLNFKTILKVTSMAILASSLFGCAEIQKTTCTTDSAYAQGVNDARDNQNMQSNYASYCPTNQSKINAAYRRGYKTGLKHQSNNSQSTSAKDGWMCLDSYGQQVCGYNCIKDDFDKVYCGQRRYDNCITDTFGHIKCGKHCRIDVNSATCQKERYSKGSSNPN